MIVNTEWGAFGDDGALDFVRTKYDKLLDKATINPGRQLFEKMISGMFLGELVRVVLERLARSGNLFNGVASAVSTPGSFPTKYVSEIAVELQQDEENQFLKTQQFQLMLSEDGSGVGAALVAAVSTRLSQESSANCLLKYQESLKSRSN
ncbi:Phosphotransferase [Aphelenchoides besseyi]|nr:Phosphotransferase [Aphelenchoides besseyi]KAI6185494.1 Phosphotransferase [Aphelenchoides besseyi]